MARVTIVQEPPFSRFLFNDIRTAPLWFLIRLYVGWSWVDAGLHKLQDPAWTQTGTALKAFWVNVTKVPPDVAKPAITYDWYRGFLQFLLETQAYTWFAKLVAAGEFLVGVALILGIFTGFAALTGAFMNMNFMLAGSSSTNPVLLILAVLILMAWKVAGIIGVDRFLLPILGTPWKGPTPARLRTAPAPA
jgi:thiosulfate dehydrogenase [quinone] large subunit